MRAKSSAMVWLLLLVSVPCASSLPFLHCHQGTQPQLCDARWCTSVAPASQRVISRRLHLLDTNSGYLLLSSCSIASAQSCKSYQSTLALPQHVSRMSRQQRCQHPQSATLSVHEHQPPSCPPSACPARSTLLAPTISNLHDCMSTNHSPAPLVPVPTALPARRRWMRTPC